MFNTYARVFNDESDEDEAAVARLLRETAGPRPQQVAPNVLTSTSATRGLTQQAVSQRRGGSRADNSVTTAAASGPAQPFTANASLGNLIDFGDDPEPRSRTSAGRADKGKQRSRGQQKVPPQVELVTLAPTDPFDFFLQQSAGHPSASTSGQPSGPQQQSQSQPQGTAVQQPQHPLDLLFGPEPTDSGRGGSAGVAEPRPGPGPGSSSRQGGPSATSFPAFGSFSDLLRPLAGGSSTGPAAAAPGPSGSGSSGVWSSFSGAGAGHPAPHAHPHHAASSAHPMQRYPGHSQSSNGIDDLLLERSRREDEELAGGLTSGQGAGSAASSSKGVYKAPGVVQTDRGAGAAADVFDPFGSGASSSFAAASGSARGGSDPAGSGATAAAAGTDGTGGDGGGARVSGSGNSFVIGGGGGEGYTMNNRELLLFAIPLFKDRLVFLPVVNWKEREDTSTVLGKVNAGVANMQQNLSSMWHSLKDKGDFSAKIYKAGQAILENMNAEERLMRNIPRKANKLVVHHPAGIPPDEIQDQLTQLTSNFCYKSVGKAAVAGVMLPVAVGLEVIAVPGVGWYTAYQLFKSTSAAAGGSRLNNYLKSDKSEVRVCYAPNTKMDIYMLKSRLNPDGVLGQEDIEDLCHDIREPTLLHPLTELRSRHLRKTQTTKADYALLPMSTPDMDEQYGSGPKKMD